MIAIYRNNITDKIILPWIDEHLAGNHIDDIGGFLPFNSGTPTALQMRDCLTNFKIVFFLGKET